MTRHLCDIAGSRRKLAATKTGWRDNVELLFGNKKNQTCGNRKHHSLYHHFLNLPLDRSQKQGNVKLYSQVDEGKSIGYRSPLLTGEGGWYPWNLGHYLLFYPLKKTNSHVWPFFTPNARILVINLLLLVTEPSSRFTDGGRQPFHYICIYRPIIWISQPVKILSWVPLFNKSQSKSHLFSMHSVPL